jgi:hypothetical protein
MPPLLSPCKASAKCLRTKPRPIGDAIASTVAWFRAEDANHR